MKNSPIRSNLVQENLRGQKIAAAFLFALDDGNFVEPDAIFSAIRLIKNEGELRGFLRVVQKRIERGGA